MNAPKWVSQDVPLYKALLSDIFPGLADFKPPQDSFESRMKAELCIKDRFPLHTHVKAESRARILLCNTIAYYCYDTSTSYYLMIFMICFYSCWKSISCDMRQHVPICVFLYAMFGMLIYPTLQESSFLCLTMASWKRWYGKFWTRWDAKRSSILWTNASAFMRLEWIKVSAFALTCLNNIFLLCVCLLYYTFGLRKCSCLKILGVFHYFNQEQYF